MRHFVLDDVFQERLEIKFGNDQDSHLAMIFSGLQPDSLSRRAYTTKEGSVNLARS
jgi:hypothetical protein